MPIEWRELVLICFACGHLSILSEKNPTEAVDDFERNAMTETTFPRTNRVVTAISHARHSVTAAASLDIDEYV